MGIKKQLSLGVMSAALGLSLVGGGTYAYFSDSEVTDSTFAAGTLDLAADPSTIIDVDNIKPGDTVLRSFELQNNGSLDIGKVTLDTAYTVNDVNSDNQEDLGKYIKVEFLYNADELSEVIYETTLEELKDMTPEAVNQHIFYPDFGDKGLPAGSIDDLVVKFEFVDNDEDQNEFQGDSLELNWTFNAKQTEGEAK